MISTLVGEYDTEPVRGLPEPLPAGERILWQGAPERRAVQRYIVHGRALLAYFAALLLGEIVFGLSGSRGPLGLIAGLALVGVLGAAALGFFALMARLTARTTLYTITNRRVVLRIGIALPVTVNLPYKIIDGLALKRHADGTGDLTLALGRGRLGYLHLWPHVRPWRLTRPEPALRCVPDAAHVADLLGEALRVALEREAVRT